MTEKARLASYVDKVAPAGSDLYYALLFGGEQRDTIGALHALASEIAGCSQNPAEPEPGRIKLQWWAEEITRFADGEQRHPLMLILDNTLRGTIGIGHVQHMLRNAAVLLNEPPPSSPPEVLRHFQQQAAPLFEAIGALSSKPAPSAAPLGGAVMLVDEARVMCARHTRFASEDGGFDVASLMTAAAQALDDAMQGVAPAERAPLRTLVIQATLAQRWLATAARSGSFDAPALSPLSKLWIAWRTARANV